MYKNETEDSYVEAVTGTIWTNKELMIQMLTIIYTVGLLVIFSPIWLPIYIIISLYNIIMFIYLNLYHLVILPKHIYNVILNYNKENK